MLAFAGPAVAHEDEPPTPVQPAPTPAPTRPAAAAIPAPAVDAALAGHYYLQGIMETGSELLLAADGSFQWYFTYGALDLAARGRWRDGEGRVVLEVEEFLAPPGYEQMKFKQLVLRAEGADPTTAELIPAWPWDDGAERGHYSRD